MRTNPAGIDLIKHFESLRLKAYKPTPYDVWTIGYGHTEGVAKGMEITAEEAEAMLRADLAVYEAGVGKSLGGAATTENQFAAMVSLAFNIGLGGFKSSSVLRFHREGNAARASAAFTLWNKQRQADGTMKVVAGLTRRRNAERVLYLKP